MKNVHSPLLLYGPDYCLINYALTVRRVDKETFRQHFRNIYIFAKIDCYYFLSSFQQNQINIIDNFSRENLVYVVSTLLFPSSMHQAHYEGRGRNAGIVNTIYYSISFG